MTSAGGPGDRPARKRRRWPLSPRSRRDQGDAAALLGETIPAVTVGRDRPAAGPVELSPQEADGDVAPLGAVGRARIAAARLLLERSGTDVHDLVSISELADLYRSAWSALPAHLRWDIGPVLDAVAVAIGEHVVRAHDGVEWVGYGPGDEPALHGPRLQRPARPIEAARQSWAARHHGWVRHYVEALRHEIGRAD